MSDQPQPAAPSKGSTDSSQIPSASGASSSSFMSQFYTPMNPTYTPMNPANLPQQPQLSVPTPSLPPPQHSGSAAPSFITSQNQLPIQTSRPPLGAGAALMLANLTTMPGFLSETAIQEARLEYANQQRRQQQQQRQELPSPTQPFQPAHSSAQALHRPITQSYHHLNTMPTYPQTTPISAASTDPNAAIGALLKELQQTGPLPYASSSTPTISPSHQTSASSKTSPPELEPAVQEDYSNGKITPQLLKRLATIAETDAQQGDLLLKEIGRLREKQTSSEKSLFADRQALLAKHKKDLVKLQANEIMGMNVKTIIQQTKTAHVEELKQFDRNVIRQMDKEIRAVQESLSRRGVPMMAYSKDPAIIASQIRVLGLLQDMLQT